MINTTCRGSRPSRQRVCKPSPAAPTIRFGHFPVSWRIVSHVIHSRGIQSPSIRSNTATSGELRTMSDRAWLQHYPAGIPAEIDIARYASLPDLLDEMVEKFGGRPAFHNLGRTISFSGLDRMSRRFAAFLQDLRGAARGDRVAVMLPNLLQYPRRPLRNPAGRDDGRQRQPALHGARARAAAQGLRGENDRRPREFRRNGAEDAAEDGGRARRHDAGRRHAFRAEAMVRQLRRQAGEEDGAALAYRRNDPVYRGDGPREEIPARTDLPDARRRRVPAVHGRDDRHLQGSDAYAREHPLQYGADGSLGVSPLGGGSRDRDRPAADVPRLLPHHDARPHEMGMPECPDHQSSRPFRVREGAPALEIHRHDRCEYPVQGASGHGRFREAEFLLAEGRCRRRGFRAETGCRAMAAGHGSASAGGVRIDRELTGRVRTPGEHPLGRHDRIPYPFDRG